MRRTVSPSQKFTLAALISAAALAIGPGSLLATPIPFTVGGEFNLGNFSVAVNGGNPACVIFYTGANPPACSAVNNLTGTVTLNAPSDPIFGTVNTTTGTMEELPPNEGAPPESGALVLNGFTFDLLAFVTPAYQTCSGATPVGTDCIIPGSPFVFDQNNTTQPEVTVSLSETLCGYVTSSSPGVNCSSGTVYQASLTSQFVGTIDGNSGDPATLLELLTIIGGGGTVTDAISGTYSPVPEPISLMLIGSGLISLSLFGRRRRKS
jgi:hypothetical protein